MQILWCIRWTFHPCFILVMQVLDHRKLSLFNLFLSFAMWVTVPWLILEVFRFGRAVLFRTCWIYLVFLPDDFIWRFVPKALSFQNYLATSLHIEVFLHLNAASNLSGRGWGGLMGECVWHILWWHRGICAHCGECHFSLECTPRREGGGDNRYLQALQIMCDAL